MIDPPEHQDLLEDVLAEVSPPDYREALLRSTLQLARRRRRSRRLRQGAGALAALMLAVWFAWHNESGRNRVVRPAAKLSQPSYRLVDTQPFAAGAAVHSGRYAGLAVISSESTVTQVATGGGGFHYIDDDQLLALLARPAILVRTGPNAEELVLADTSELSSAPASDGRAQ